MESRYVQGVHLGLAAKMAIFERSDRSFGYGYFGAIWLIQAYL